MEIFGREINFLKTVWAGVEITKISPDHDPKRLAELFGGDGLVSQETAIKFVRILNEAYEKKRAFEDPSYTPAPLTEEEIMYLTDNEFEVLFEAAIEAYTGEEITVETEEPEKTGKKTKAQ